MGIETEQDLAAMMTALSAQCPVMARLHADHGLPPLRRRPAGFEGLVHVVVFQQISTLAAQAIWRRTQEVMGAITPERLRCGQRRGLSRIGPVAPQGPDSPRRRRGCSRRQP